MSFHLTHDGFVPSLRTDLNLSVPSPSTGTEVIEVRPIGQPRLMMMFGFELSIARLLDGRRTADQVLAICASLGLPLTLHSLEAFADRLGSHGLLGGVATQDRASRNDWPPAVRSLYRSAMRAAREGDGPGAHQDLEQLLRLAPATEEAKQLKLSLELDPKPRLNFRALLYEVQKSWSAPSLIPTQWLNAAWAQVRRLGWMPWPVMGVMVLVGGASLVPLPRVTAAHAMIQPSSRITVFSDGAGVVQSVAVHDGDRVAAGTPLFTWRNASLKPGAEFVATAEVTGRVSGLALKEGDPVSLGQRVMRLDELGRLNVVATVTPKNARSFRADEQVTLAFDHVTLPGVISAVEGNELMVEVADPGKALDYGSARVDIGREAKTLLQMISR